MNRRRIKNALLSVGLFGPAWRVYRRVVGPFRAEATRQETALYAHFLRPGDLCFDVGANVGKKTEVFLRLGARVVAVEPQPDCVREVRARFGGDPRLQVVSKAVGREPGTARMWVNPEFGPLVSSLRPDWTPQSDTEIEVELTTLDRLVEEFGVPAFCKIDVEGYELEALQGLSRPVPALSIEYQKKSIDLTLKCLESLARFGDARVNFTRYDEPRFLLDDWVRLDDVPRRLDWVLEQSAWGDLFVDWRPAPPRG